MANLTFGRRLFGRHIFASPVSGSSVSNITIKYKKALVQIIAYAQDGTKTAIFANDVEQTPFVSVDFELLSTGCGSCKLKFNKLPQTTELKYGQRIDIHLFGDWRPWYSGYILTIPAHGGTSESFEITAKGYFDKLKNVLLFEQYENMEVTDIVKDIAQKIEHKTGIKANSSKMHMVNYKISKIVFDGVDAKEALKQLSEFAVDWVYGVDEQRDLFFKIRNDKINEEARFWVGQHLNSFEPTINVDKIVNNAHIKGAGLDDKGESWLCKLQDTESQNKYGIYEAVWTLPTAYTEEDAKRWGQSELDKYKQPIFSAKVKGLNLEYPKPDGEFWVRRLSCDGKAAITDLNGSQRSYPITKIKYTISESKGITCDMELGEPPFKIEKYLKDKERDAKNNELLQQAANKQLR